MRERPAGDNERIDLLVGEPRPTEFFNGIRGESSLDQFDEVLVGTQPRDTEDLLDAFEQVRLLWSISNGSFRHTSPGLARCHSLYGILPNANYSPGRVGNWRGHPSCPQGHSALCRASCRHVGSDAPIVLKELSDVRKLPMIIPMPTPARQQRYDRLRNLVQRHRRRDHRHRRRNPALDGAWLARRSTGGRGRLDVVDLTDPELRQEVLKLRRRV